MSRLHRVVRDGAIACAAASIAYDRLGAPEFASASFADGASERERVVIWRDARRSRAGALVEGDVVTLERTRASGERMRSVQVIARVGGGAGRGRCELRASDRWRADGGEAETDAGDVPCGAIDGRVGAILWPPHRVGGVERAHARGM